MIAMSNFSSDPLQLPLSHRPHLLLDLAAHLSPFRSAPESSAHLETWARQILYDTIVSANARAVFIDGTLEGRSIKEHALQVLGDREDMCALL